MRSSTPVQLLSLVPVGHNQLVGDVEQFARKRKNRSEAETNRLERQGHEMGSASSTAQVGPQNSQRNHRVMVHARGEAQQDPLAQIHSVKQKIVEKGISQTKRLNRHKVGPGEDSDFSQWRT